MKMVISANQKELFQKMTEKCRVVGWGGMALRSNKAKAKGIIYGFEENRRTLSLSLHLPLFMCQHCNDGIGRR